MCKYADAQYELRLVASDNLNENYTTVVIHVKDVNDNPPVFDRPTYEAQITEEDDRNLPKRILQVCKPNEKLPPPALVDINMIYFCIHSGHLYIFLKIYFISQHVLFWFHIFSNFASCLPFFFFFFLFPFLIILVGQKQKYDLTLVASDSLNESVTRVVILIKDSNDLPPMFNQTQYSANALEEMTDPLPFKLLQVVIVPRSPRPTMWI